MSVDLHELLEGKWEDGTRPKDLFADHVGKQPEDFVASITSGIGSKNRRIANGCAELASLLSEQRPDLLIPYIDLFLEKLEAREKVVRWEAVCTIGNLATLDTAGRVAAQVPLLTALLRDDSIVLQGHAVRALTKIATARPRTAKTVLESLIASADAFEGNRVGFVIEAMEAFIRLGDFDDTVRAFLEPRLESPIPVVARKARKAWKVLLSETESRPRR